MRLGEIPKLRPYFNGRAVGNGAPYFVHLLVGDGDAAVRPILQPMLRSNPAVSVGQAVDEDVPSGGNALLAGGCAFLRVWIRDVN